MHIIINHSSMIPIYEQLLDQIKENIINGILKENDPLPSVRSLSAELRISALTVKKAYDRLEEEQLVVTVHGKGTYVRAADTDLACEARRRAVEEELAAVVEKARMQGMSNAEIRELLEILLEEA